MRKCVLQALLQAPRALLVTRVWLYRDCTIRLHVGAAVTAPGLPAAVGCRPARLTTSPQFIHPPPRPPARRGGPRGITRVLGCMRTNPDPQMMITSAAFICLVDVPANLPPKMVCSTIVNLGRFFVSQWVPVDHSLPIAITLCAHVFGTRTAARPRLLRRGRAPHRTFPPGTHTQQHRGPLTPRHRPPTPPPLA